ncbi:MAG: class I SAM-dependent methyltransferase [Pseudolysinimonas sp.]
MSDELRTHWERVYQGAPPTAASWYEPIPAISLELIRKSGVGQDAPILDVGGGASTLVDHLLATGFRDVTVLDVADAALAAAKARIGHASAEVHWVVSDVAAFRPARRYALWHDRAVFHFHVDPQRRDQYLTVLRSTLAPGGHVIVATFGPQGPTRCSGLDVQRYSERELSAVLGPGFRLVEARLEDHATPAGGRQQFLYGCWKSGG